MVLAVGVGAFTAAIFHLMTHAFFKACLFLGSGSVIHGCGGEQDMRKMGGLKKYMPSTHMTMLIATIAIAGIPPLAGFFSKDEILASTFFKRFETLGTPWAQFPLILWVLGMLAAMGTAFYMFRLYYMTFVHEYRGGEAEAHHGADDHGHHDADDHGHHGHGAPHESPASMTGVLWILALGSIVVGFVGFPLALLGIHKPTWFQSWLEPILLPLGEHPFHFHSAPLGIEVVLILASIAVAVIGILFARSFYGMDASWSKPKAFAESWPGVHRIVENKYYVDELYQATVIRGTIVLSNVLAWIDSHIVDGLVNLVGWLSVYLFGNGSSTFDKYIVDGAVNGVATSARRGSTALRRVQTGVVQNYALIMGSGLVLLAAIYLFMKP